MDTNLHEASYDLKHLFEKSLEKHDSRTAVRYDGEEVTYGELRHDVYALSNALVDHGVQPDDRVALLMSNRLEFVVAELAVIQANAVTVMLNDMLGRDEIEYMLDDSGATMLICGPEFSDLSRQVQTTVDTLKDVVFIDADAGDRSGHYNFETLLTRGSSTAPPDRTPEPDDTVSHLYTGGTTGKPKGVLHTHRSRTMLHYSVLIELGLSSEDTVLVTTPLPHSAGSFTRASLLTGATVVLRSAYDVERTLADIENHGVSWTFMVPTMIYRLLDHPEIDAADLSSLETLVYGAAPMKPTRLREGIDRFGPVFTQFYGQTEVPNLITTLGKLEHERAILEDRDDVLSSAGQECLMSDVKIVDPDNGEELPPEEPGEILASAPYTMAQYFERPEKTDETIDGEWVRTGDIGRRDKSGNVTLLDRMSNMVITGGMNVYTTEVEDVLAKHSGVKNVAVIGVPDADWGEAVTAYVIPYGETTETATEVTQFAKDRLSAYKVPKEVVLVEELPETPYGKIDKNALRDQHWDGQERQIN